MYRKFVVMGIILTLLATAARGQDLIITEIMWKSSHPDPDPVTAIGGLAQGDWVELMNVGTSPLNLAGYLFDDADQLFGADYGIFPDFEMQPGEVIIYLREDCPNDWRAAWSTPENDLTDLRIISEQTMDPASFDAFSGISSGGDEANFYAPTAIDADGFVTGEAPVATVTVPSIGSNAGRTWQFDSSGNFLDGSTGNVNGFSTLGANGSYEAIDDGSELPPPFAALDIASPGYVEGVGAPRFPDQPHLPCLDGAPGDFDSNEIYECADVDALVAEIVAGTNDELFDLTGDMIVDNDDLTAWLAEAGAGLNASGGAFLVGDASLDGVVDVSDFNIWNGNQFSGDAGWCGGDFNADGFTDVSDFNLWNGNQFLASDNGGEGNVNSVPEPAGWLLALIAVLPFVSRRRS